MTGYEILSIDDLERYPSADDSCVLRPLRRRLGLRSFGVNVWVGEKAGDGVIEAHREPTGTEELYLVLRGRARFVVGDDAFDAPVGMLVHAPPSTLRAATALEPGTAVLAAGAKAGAAFTPSAWEDFFVASGRLQQGDVSGGRALVAEALARDPDAWQGAFHAACFEALAGEPERSLEHLRRAVAIDPRAARAAAREERELDPVRGDPRFQELLA